MKIKTVQEHEESIMDKYGYENHPELIKELAEARWRINTLDNEVIKLRVNNLLTDTKQLNQEEPKGWDI